MARHPQTDFCSFSYFPQNSYSGTKVWDGSGWGRSPNPLPAREAWLSVDSAQSLLKRVRLSEVPGVWSSVKATAHPRTAEDPVPSSPVNVRGFANTGPNTEPHSDKRNT